MTSTHSTSDTTTGGSATPTRVGSPGELIRAVPYLLGFHPDPGSLVLVGLRAGRVIVSARVDLPDLAPATVGQVLVALRRGEADSYLGIVYTTPDAATTGAATGSLPHADLITALAALAGEHGPALADALLVAGGRFWSYLCDDPACCPPQGRLVDPSTGAVEAQAVWAGIAPLPDRAALAATLDPVPAQVGPGLLAAAERDATDARTSTGGSARFARAAVRALYAAARTLAATADAGPSDAGLSDEVLSDEVVARLGVALEVIGVRDAVWLAQDAGRLDGDQLWRQLAQRLPGEYAAAPLFLAGWTAWRAGDGALANIAAERAVTVDPAYSAAQLLQTVLQEGIDPRRTPRLHR